MDFKNIDLKFLLGKSKQEVIDELGFEFNHFPSKVWTYYMYKNWFGRKTFLKLFFENGNVIKVIKKDSF